MGAVATRKMHQTTVRFGPDLWEALEQECEQLGVSVAQYLREAALTRLVYAAGRRGDHDFEAALAIAVGELPGEADSVELETIATPARSASTAEERARSEATEAAALAAQSRLVRQRARDLRDLAAKRRTG